MPPNENPGRRKKPFLIFLLITVPVLLFIGWSQASLNLSFIRPASAGQTILLVAVSALIFLAFIIFGLILLRTLLKLHLERQKEKLGSRFKTKMVAAFLALTLLPVFFLFVFAYGLLNRSIDKWFSIPFDVVRHDASRVVGELKNQSQGRSSHLADDLISDPELAAAITSGRRNAIERVLRSGIPHLRSESAMVYSPDGKLLGSVGRLQIPSRSVFEHLPGGFAALSAQGVSFREKYQDDEAFVSIRTLRSPPGRVLGGIVTATRLPLNVARIAAEIQSEAQRYDQLSGQRKAVKRTYLLLLCLLTLIIIFSATWFALFLSKQVTVPIEALADATHEISKGNLAYRVSARGDDELGILIQSFNEMAGQLQENRIAIERAAMDLQRANRAIEDRGNIMEAILENIPTGVVSFDPQGRIMRSNSAAERMFGSETIKNARRLADLFHPEEVRDVARLLRRASRQGVVTHQMELNLGGRQAVVALTISMIRARRGALGSLLVLEDLTELLRAQQALVWQEVAQRIAHEIKNPLTPVQLSAERIQRWIERTGRQLPNKELVAAVEQSAALIQREVMTLKTLVDEFSRFARFPESRPVSSDLNAITGKALEVFDGRLDGIILRRELAVELPSIYADPDQIKRVLINLIDNAAEALENSAVKEIWISTAFDAERDMVQLIVADTGPGIPADAKERLFLPFFSTKRRGTGLGLAIVNRIVTEHNGTLRVEENFPLGTKLIIELPAERATIAQPTAKI